MQFVEQDGCWLLMEEAAQAGAALIAMLHSLVEVAAMKTFCELYLTGWSPAPFTLHHAGREYRATRIRTVAAGCPCRSSVRPNGWAGSRRSSCWTDFRWLGALVPRNNDYRHLSGSAET